MSTRTNSPGTPPLPHALTPLIGRERELEAVRSLLLRAGVRLVTLTGPPGVGKTRLALAAAATARHAAAFGDGVWFVSLASVVDAALVFPAICSALGLQHPGPAAPLDRATAYLRSKRALLVLDNVEQVLAAAPDLSALLRECPGLVVLVTSRAVLCVYGEHQFPVPPLTLPPSPRGDVPPRPSEGARCEAVRLFVERARAAAPDFALGPDNADAVHSLCVHLDGIPLAIELAAAWVKVLPPESLLPWLKQRLDVLLVGPRDAPARKQSLREAISWSHTLLEEPQRVVFRRLAAFSGGFTLEAAAAVCAAGDPTQEPDGADVRHHTDVLAGIGSLLDKSLLQRAAAPASRAEPRFLMLNTIRAFALEQLDASGEADAVRRRHAAYYRALAGPPELPRYCLGQPAAGKAPDVLEADVGNYRDALEWLLAQRQGAAALRLAAALYPLWAVGGHYGEGRGWLEQGLGAIGDAPVALRAWGLFALGALAGKHGDRALRRPVLEESLALYRELNDTAHVGAVLAQLGYAAFNRCEYAAARTLIEEALAVLTDLDDSVGSAFCRMVLGSAARMEGTHAHARGLLEESLEVFRTCGDQQFLAFLCHRGLGNLARDEGDHARASSHIRETLLTGGRLHIGTYASTAVLDAARLAAATGQAAAGARLLGAADALRAATQSHWRPIDLVDREHAMAALRAALPEVVFGAQVHEGAAMSLTAAIAFGLETLDLVSERVANPSHAVLRALSPLTPREQQVASLVAQGFSNREIAAQLVITTRTAENHVEHVLRTLGFRSRAQIGAWTATQGLLTSHPERDSAAQAPVRRNRAVPSSPNEPSLQSGAPAAVRGAGEAPDQCTRTTACSDSPPAAGEPEHAHAMIRGRRRGELTRREMEVLRLVAAGGTDRQIAGNLLLSEKTVGRHLANIFRKLGVSSRAAASVVAMRAGIAA